MATSDVAALADRIAQLETVVTSQQAALQAATARSDQLQAEMATMLARAQENVWASLADMVTMQARIARRLTQGLMAEAGPPQGSMPSATPLSTTPVATAAPSSVAKARGLLLEPPQLVMATMAPPTPLGERSEIAAKTRMVKNLVWWGPPVPKTSLRLTADLLRKNWRRVRERRLGLRGAELTPLRLPSQTLVGTHGRIPLGFFSDEQRTPQTLVDRRVQGKASFFSGDDEELQPPWAQKSFVA